MKLNEVGDVPIGDSPQVQAQLTGDVNGAASSVSAGADATVPSEVVASSSWWQDMLKAETGPGEIGDYIEHPLNFNKSAWMARLIRGLTGLVGNLRLALVDIGLALVEGWKARVAAVKQDAAEQ